MSGAAIDPEQAARVAAALRGVAAAMQQLAAQTDLAAVQVARLAAAMRGGAE